MRGKRRNVNTCPKKEIKGIQFALGNEELWTRYGITEIKYAETEKDGIPVPQGLSDARTGPTDKWAHCLTCDEKLINCPGHISYLRLGKACYHPGYIKPVSLILRSVCHSCGKLLMKKEDILVKKYAWIEKKTSSASKKYLVCGTITEEEEEDEDDDGIHIEGGCGAKQRKYIVEQPIIFQTYDKDTDDGKKKRVKKPVTAEKALMILKKISDEDATYLGFGSKWVKPKDLILTVLAVPPPCVRPSIMMDSTRKGLDDLTHKLFSIVKYSNIIREHISTQSTGDEISDNAYSLQYHVSTYMDNAIPRVPQDTHRSSRALKALKQRLKDKEGRVRQNLSGKRVDFSGRNVITPDPNIDIEELGIPLEIAMNLTYPLKVNRSNMEECYRLLRNGPTKYPGVNYLLKKTRGKYRRFDLKITKDPALLQLRPGDILERHLIDGDVLINNRQPTLHKPSMMGHYVKVLPGRTFRLSEAVTTPYNADFDGNCFIIIINFLLFSNR